MFDLVARVFKFYSARAKQLYPDGPIPFKMHTFPNQLMQSLPPPLTLLIYLSLAVSALAAGSTFASLALGLPPHFWTIPVAFAITLPYHLAILFLARVEPHGSPRVFSSGNNTWGFVASTFWTGALCTSVVTTILMARRDHRQQRDINLGCALCAWSLLEDGLIWSITLLSYRERRRVLYAAKWRPNGSSNGQSWSFNKPELAFPWRVHSHS
ncbi:hypothetical protein E1B28_010114 [Marasmius oreades]|uniref:Uncharacterized protein n=1 Tax=Marasmius oreades TaxID=181124 RepID=A0A9P7RX56_9AGAR|nr:uncharacterized protein E1B28_010114 [Marasmius oreades]KAG7091057.1 hypothetical protein E1B28_010114 [Marasmius oreades]